MFPSLRFHVSSLWFHVSVVAVPCFRGCDSMCWSLRFHVFVVAVPCVGRCGSVFWSLRFRVSVVAMPCVGRRNSVLLSLEFRVLVVAIPLFLHVIMLGSLHRNRFGIHSLYCLAIFYDLGESEMAERKYAKKPLTQNSTPNACDFDSKWAQTSSTTCRSPRTSSSRNRAMDIFQPMWLQSAFPTSQTFRRKQDENVNSCTCLDPSKCTYHRLISFCPDAPHPIGRIVKAGWFAMSSQSAGDQRPQI